MGNCCGKRGRNEDPNAPKPPSKPKGGPPPLIRVQKSVRPSSQEMKKRKEGYGSKIKDRLRSIQRDLRMEERKREAARRKQLEEEEEDRLDLEEEEAELRRISEKKRRKAEQKAEKEELIREEPFSARRSTSRSTRSPSVTSPPSSPLRLSSSIDKKKLSNSKDDLFKKEESPKKERLSMEKKEEVLVQSPEEKKKERSEPAIIELQSSDSEAEHKGMDSGKEDSEDDMETSKSEEESKRVELDDSDEEIEKQSAPEETEHYPIVRSLYKYSGRNERELSFQLSDEIAYFKEEYGGWWRGQNLRTQEIGWFPSNYIQETGRTMEMPKIKKEVEGSAEVEEEQSSFSPKVVVNVAKKVSSGIARLQQQLAKSKTKNSLFTKLGIRGSVDVGEISDED